MTDRIEIIDTTLRDGQQCIWAMNMRTGWMLPALEELDGAGFEAMEFYVPVVQIKKMIRDLNEDPFQWLRLGTARATQTPLRLHGGYRSGLGRVPECISRLLLKTVVDAGITTGRISDPWNDFANLKDEHDEMRKMGMESVVNIIYTVSPRHTAAYFIERTRDAAALRPYRLCLKDVGGLLTPESLREILPGMIAAAGDIPIELHLHCNNGLATYNVQEAAALGLRHIHTSLPPVADGLSLPSTLDVFHNLRARGYDVPLDEPRMRRVSEHLFGLAQREGLPVSRPLAYDETIYTHQIPGGMTSSLEFQLEKVGMGGRMGLIKEEVAQMRAEFGYPIMITPMAQYIGTQAAVNVITGARYKQVTDEIIEYTLGLWGREAVEHMDPNVRDRILDRPRAREIAARAAPPEPSLAELRRALGGTLTDEELIVRSYVDEAALARFRNTPPVVEEPIGRSPLVSLIAGLANLSAHESVSVRKGDVSVALSRS
ncbi:hypothetical protein [Salipiger abyssi]|uniref:hypothetical protein n=1 Tax=Salipiger abyssi TaxID=1250539 RepID=UPI001A8DE09B|nr:hypothetical protein [Salipiger abyssi]MBN9887177.1 hypothetical protein [Salipiger abyssi]